FVSHCLYFQAVDGLRVFLVSGVQTCALPISPRRSVGPRPTPGPAPPARPPPESAVARPCREGSGRPGRSAMTSEVIESATPRPRSDERRVGEALGPSCLLYTVRHCSEAVHLP